MENTENNRKAFEFFINIMKNDTLKEIIRNRKNYYYSLFLTDFTRMTEEIQKEYEKTDEGIADKISKLRKMLEKN